MVMSRSETSSLRTPQSDDFTRVVDSIQPISTGTMPGMVKSSHVQRQQWRPVRSVSNDTTAKANSSLRESTSQEKKDTATSPVQQERNINLS